MSDLTAAPVKGIINAYQRGVVLTQRICKIAHNGSSMHTLDTLASAQLLQESLKHSAERIREAYNVSVGGVGQRFVEGIIGDVAITNRLQALTINLQDHFMELDAYMDDPGAFDVGTFSYIRGESERACKQATYTLGLLEKTIIQAGLQKYSLRLSGESLLSSNEADSQSSSSLTPPATANSEESTETQTSPRTLPKSHTHQQTQQSALQAYASGRENSYTHSSKDSNALYANLPTAGSYGMYKEAGPPPPPKPSKSKPAPLPTNHAWSKNDRSLRSPLKLPEPPQYSDDSVRDVSNVDIKFTGLSLRAKMRSQSNSSLHSPSVLSEMLKDAPTFADKEAATAALIRSADVVRQRKIDEDLLGKRRRNRESAGHLRSYSANSSQHAPSNSSIIGNIMDILQPMGKGVTAGDSQHVGHSEIRSNTLEQGSGRISEAVNPVRHVAELQLSDTYEEIRVDDKDQNDVHPLLRISPRPTTPLPSRTVNHDQSPTSIYSRHTDACDSLRRLETGHSDLEVADSHGLTNGSRQDIVGSSSFPWSATTPQIEDGIEVSSPGLYSDTGLMLASEDGRQLLPSLHPILSPDQDSQTVPITQESSFYKYGGFCEGAKILRKGQKSLKVQKKPAGLGFTAVVSMKCPNCTYEIGFQTYEADMALDRAAIFTVKGGNGSLRFRQRFLTKSHLVAKHILDSAYGCLFCIEESRTVHGHDATVFFSVTALLNHIQKHQRPLPAVSGVTVLYGTNVDALDFDLSFRDMLPSPDPFDSIRNKLQDRPTARTIVDHRSHHKGFRGEDPDGHATLQFAIGAHIMGITYPERHGGRWCCGYHDNVQALIPASMVQLDAPMDAPHPNPKSTMIATAKWQYKAPSYLNDTWLSFKAGEMISNISFNHQEQWCWSGMNSKGKYGIFHSAFVKDLTDRESSEREGSVKSVKMPAGSLSQTSTRSSGPRGSVSTAGRSTGSDIFDGRNSSLLSPPTTSSFPSPRRIMSRISFSSETSNIDTLASSASSVVHPGRRVTESLRPVRRRGSFDSVISGMSIETIGANTSEVSEGRAATAIPKLKSSNSVFRPVKFLGLGRSRTSASNSKEKSAQTRGSEESDVSARLKMEGLL